MGRAGTLLSALTLGAMRSILYLKNNYGGFRLPIDTFKSGLRGYQQIKLVKDTDFF